MLQRTPKPIDKGVYALILLLDRDRRIAVGRLGRFRFSAGTYVYVGSGWGPGGLSARIDRHLRRKKNRRWHIDYLRRYATIIEIWANSSRPDAEHQWAAVFGSLENALVPAAKFGSSDCRCPTHLFYRPGTFCIQEFNRSLPPHRLGELAAHIWHAGIG